MTSPLRFRNITASPEDPVETWPFEGVLAAVERGTLPDWRRLARAIQADPWGPVAQQVLEAVQLSRPYGTAELLEGVVSRARERAADSERAEVAAEIRESRERIRTVAAGFRRTSGNVAVPPVHVHVRKGRALGRADGAGTASGAKLPEPRGRVSLRLCA